MAAGKLIDLLFEFHHMMAGQGEADGVGMAAETGKQLVAGFESVQKMQGCNGTAGAVGLLSVNCNDQGRTIGFLYDARGHNANHSSMPALAIKNNAGLL